MWKEVVKEFFGDSGCDKKSGVGGKMFDYTYILKQVMEGRNLLESDMSDAFDNIMEGKFTPAQIAAFLVALRYKGETPQEIAAAALSMRRHSIKIDVAGIPVIDTCGTGGDGLGTFNISTTAAFIAAGAGIKVAKHGNRAVSSRCGSADALTELGVNINIEPEQVEECIREAGIGFLLAPKLHPAMKHAAPVRAELGIRTIFNMLGPLTNPAGTRSQLLGVFAPELTECFAHVLKALGSKRAIIVHGNDGMDEITITTTTRITELTEDEKIKTYDFNPLPYIESFYTLSDIKGGDARTNASILKSILDGTNKGAQLKIALLNAAGAIIAGGRAKDFNSAYRIALSSVESGKALKALNKLIEISNAI
jgi:anthranilate phosphoribosyltransferase